MEGERKKSKIKIPKFKERPIFKFQGLPPGELYLSERGDADRSRDDV
jgi:hypothetical protein